MIAAALTPTGSDGLAEQQFAGLLEAGRGRQLHSLALDSVLLAQLIPAGNAWSPGRSASGRLVLFNGQFHNRSAITAKLGLGALDDASLYAAALDRWGDQADDQVIGHYCSIAFRPGDRALRCARSPIEAPPLHFRIVAGRVIAASLPRPLFWRDPSPRQVNLDRLSRTMLVDFSDRYSGLYQDCGRIPQGSAAMLSPQGWSEVWRYDLFARPEVRMRRAEDYVEAAQALLDEAVAATLDGAKRPGILLSGGLDSALVTASVLEQAGPDTRVYGFAHGPEQEWTEPAAPPGGFLREFPAVERFARFHPALKVEYFTNEGFDFRHGQDELLRAMDCGTPSVGLTWAHQAMHERAAELGCDVLLSPNWGNETFSNTAPWAWSEWLLRGQWGTLARALAGNPGDQRPLWQRVLSRAVLPLLPAPLWRGVHRLWHGELPDPLASSALSPQWVAQHNLLDRARAGGFEPKRVQFRSKRQFWEWIMAEDGQDREQYAQGIELLHGVPLRDPAAYRPLVEFCYGLPTEVFWREGTDRWLARAMARGRMPEEQRLRREIGYHHVDWHQRISRAREPLMAELERMASDPDIAAMIDLPRLRRLLADLPKRDPVLDAQALPYVTALPIAVAAARFIAYAKGRNDI